MTVLSCLLVAIEMLSEALCVRILSDLELGDAKVLVGGHGNERSFWKDESGETISL